MDTVELLIKKKIMMCQGDEAKVERAFCQFQEEETTFS